MTALEAKYIENLVTKCIQDNSDAIQESLISGFDSSMKSEEVLSKMIIRSVSISSQISVQIVMELLEQAGVVKLDEERLKRLSLHIVK
ncbi:hypothetical protein [uncultured Bacteroides sp.]|uniref:hypothetical protein n=1 Tax=uncultured Bacteroides sp. TaxID=162156 RepID=UPI0026124A18|nr:hypothetical protein [uncultured Bacteroides sp.]